jgi:thiol-disulfide isomerase/thioredoxin
MEYLDRLSIQSPDSLIKAVDTIIDKSKKNEKILQFTLQKILNKYAKTKIMCLDAVYVHVALKYYTKELATWLEKDDLIRIRQEARSMSSTLCNKSAPSLNLKTPEGKHQSLYEINTDYTVLVFWDPDCGHCKKSIPKLKKLYDDLMKGNNIEVYSVCTEMEEQKWIDFIKKHDLDWINVADMEVKSNFRSYYYIKSTPQIFLLNKKKKIIAKKIGVEQLEEVLKDQLKRNKESE